MATPINPALVELLSHASGSVGISETAARPNSVIPNANGIGTPKDESPIAVAMPGTISTALERPLATGCNVL